MSDNHGASCNQDTRLENFAAELALAAYPFALRHGARESNRDAREGLHQAFRGAIREKVRGSVGGHRREAHLHPFNPRVRL